MTVLVFVNPELPMSEELDLLLQQLDERQIGYKLLDTNDKNHAAEVEARDITSTPTIVVSQDDGTEVERWQHNTPTPDQVAYAFGHV